MEDEDDDIFGSKGKFGKGKGLFDDDDDDDNEVLHFNNYGIPLCLILPMYYISSFNAAKMDNFQMKNSNIFLKFALNMNCGYM